MTPSLPGSGSGQALDRLFGLYMVAAAVPLAFPGRPATWPLLAAAHVLVVLIAWPPPALRRAAGGLRRPRSLAAWGPLLLVPALYTELAVLNRAVHGGAFFDDVVLRWEQALFGSQPSRDWAAAAPLPWLSESLHAAYISYYFIIFIPPLLIWLRRSEEDFRAAVFALMLSFFVHYVFFIYFPVQGPRYVFPPPGGELADGLFYQLTHGILEAGSSQGAAFPSSHVGVSVTQTLIARRYLPAGAPLVALLTAGLALGAVYGGFHYAVDAAAGALLGIGAWYAAPAVRRWLAGGSTAPGRHRRPRGQPGSGRTAA